MNRSLPLKLLLLAACAHRNPEPASLQQAVLDAHAWYEMDHDLSSCDAMPAGYGTTMELPLEWGGAASGGALFYERLVCPDGAVPDTWRNGSVGSAVSQSDAPVNSKYSGYEILDSWAVLCPGDEQPRTWYANVYRLGSPCPPDGFGVVSVATFQAMASAFESLRADDHLAAVEKSLALVKVAPDWELSYLSLGNACLGFRDFECARDAFVEVLRFDPASLPALYPVAMTSLALGDDERLLDVAQRGLELTEPEHELHPVFRCMVGIGTMRTTGEQPPPEMFEAGCAAGFEICCDPR
jgi:hypothetical protein